MVPAATSSTLRRRTGRGADRPGTAVPWARWSAMSPVRPRVRTPGAAVSGAPSVNAANSAAAADNGGGNTDPGSDTSPDSESESAAGPNAAEAAAIADGPLCRRGRDSDAASRCSVRAVAASGVGSASAVGSSEEAVMSSFQYGSCGFPHGRYGGVERSKTSWSSVGARDGS